MSAEDGPQGKLFVKQAGPELRLNGKIFHFAGSNNYYLMYKSHLMTDDVLTKAAQNNFRVMRIWGSLEIGNQDGTFDMTIPKRPIRKKITGLPAFTTLKGGAYFFLPGIKALRFLSAL